MSPDQRKSWVERGFRDPVAAFREHIASARKRGIPFRMTFEEWWGVWEPHYEHRGTGVGQKCICRLRDEGAYVVGNVRIDTVKGNSAERGVVQRVQKAQATSCRTIGNHRPKPDGDGHWMWRNPFAEYVEDPLDDD